MTARGTCTCMTAAGITHPGAHRTLTVRAVPVVPAAVVAVLALRLPLVARPASSDEGGFLVLAPQWSAGGSSLYGDYWVDRPPLLVAIYQLAAAAGGLIALRIIGTLAAAATVVLMAGTARRAFGAQAAGWTALVAAALLVSPLFGSEAVNGELLAAPFIALGIRLAVEAVAAPRFGQACAAGVGVAAVLALLVKQNMADTVVFAAVCWAVAWWAGTIPGRVLAKLASSAVAGAVVGYAVVMAWAALHGTSALEVFEATYLFRIDAGQVLIESADHITRERLGRLGLAALASGAVGVVLAYAALVPHRRRDPVVWATTATAGFATVSILAGGNYWLHYLVEAVPAVALAAGALSAVGTRTSARLTVGTSVFVALSAAVALGVLVAVPEPAPGAVIGRTLSTAAQPGDTVLSAFGDPDIVLASGMSSPYPYLWSLPSRTLDPELRHLRRVLAGPEAPTWVVVISEDASRRLGANGLRSTLEARYRLVGEVCGRSIHLQRGLVRHHLEPVGSCGGLVIP